MVGMEFPMTVMITMTAVRNVGIIVPDVDKNFTLAPAAVQSARTGDLFI